MTGGASRRAGASTGDTRHVVPSVESAAAGQGSQRPTPVFYLGTHQPSWLSRVRFPLCVSHRRLDQYRQLPVARCTWVLDSGAFSELALHGGWTLPPDRYAAAVRRYQENVGRLAWASPHDYMCEPAMVAKTGLSVREHQRRTIENFVQLRKVAPDLPIIPVIQGWCIDDYLRCVDLYAAAGFDLTKESVVGVGSVCRRQATVEVAEIFEALHALSLRLHGFGVKVDGLRAYGNHVVSADSMAWSFRGRRIRGCAHRLPGQHPVASEDNCLHFARAWRQRLLYASNSFTTVGGEYPT